METIKGNYQAPNGKNYYSLVITTDKKALIFENFQCAARIVDYCKTNNIAVLTQLFMNTEPINMAKVPKKYTKTILSNI